MYELCSTLHIVLHFSVLNCILLYRAFFYFTVLYSILFYYTVLYSTVLCSTVQRCTLTFYFYISFAFQTQHLTFASYLVFLGLNMFCKFILAKIKLQSIFWGNFRINKCFFFWKLRKVFTKSWWWTLFMVFISKCIFSFVQNCV